MRIPNAANTGIVWKVQQSASSNWEEGFRDLTIYREREGHCRVPIGHLENDFQLGSWVSNQRRRKDTMSVEQRQRLDELGFIWKIQKSESSDWEEAHRCLAIYKQREGHCRVPRTHLEDGFRLGVWVTTARRCTAALIAASGGAVIEGAADQSVIFWMLPLAGTLPRQ